MKQQLIIFGAGKVAEVATYYFNRDSDYKIVAYCCDDAYVQSQRYLGKPLLSKESVLNSLPPREHAMFVAIGYQGVNTVRAEKVDWARAAGYSLARYRSPHVDGDYSIGENSMVMDAVAIQPRVSLGDNVFVWSGAMIGHHARIADHCWIAGGSAIGGVTSVGDFTFVGLNATLGHEISVGKRCMIGANTLVSKPLGDESVLILRDTDIHRLNTTQFTRISQCF